MCVPFWLVLVVLLGVISGMSDKSKVHHVALSLILAICVWGIVYGSQT